MKKLLLLAFGCALSYAANAQLTRYIVVLKNKGTNTFSLSNPSQYLGPKALARRARYNIAIDSLDLPVTPRYVDSIRLAGAVTVLNTSKWLNHVAIRTSDAAALNKINSFPFVQSVTAVASRPAPGAEVNKHLPTGSENIPAQTNFVESVTDDFYNYGIAHGQVAIHNGEFLHNLGFRGEGVHLAMLDAGFFRYQTLRTFDSVRNAGQILETWDFVNNEAGVNEDDTHGTQCLSTIAANIPGSFVGTAPKALFRLYRTEDVASEYRIEEQNMAAGLERADSAGIDICSISLGYYNFDNGINYTYADMNGNTTISARAADAAAAKGIMMVVAAGNEGNNAWHFIITPGDGDSVMTVGAVDTLSNVASFSSWGPSSDGDVKPNLAAVGLRAVVANVSTGNPVYGNGTSFATPNLAGLTACLMQAFPEYNNITVMKAMQESGTRANNPDVRIGYGIPDMQEAFVRLQQKTASMNASLNSCMNTISFGIKSAAGMVLKLERKQADETVYSTLHSVPAAGTFAVQNFTFTDDLADAPGGTAMYRLRVEIGTDTAFAADSLAVAIPTDCSSLNNNVRINPNPSTGNSLNVIVNRDATADVSIVITNASGQRMAERNFRQLPGAVVQEFDIAGWPAGAYFATVYANRKKVKTVKVIRP